jgi:hypothetical protein
MAHGGGLPRRGAAVRRPKPAASAPSADRKRKKAAAVKSVSLKNLIRSTERFLRKVLTAPPLPARRFGPMIGVQPWSLSLGTS